MTAGKVPESKSPAAEGPAPAPPETEVDGPAAAGEPADQAAADDAGPETAAPEAGPWAAGAPEADAAPEPTPEEQIAELRDQLLRAMAETENMRRRARREVEDATKYAVSNFARDVLALGDNLARALESVPPEAREGNEALGTLLDGVELTQREFLALIERHGIKRIEPMGEKFDHNFHQAMFEVEDPASEPGTVVQVIQPGYVISGRLLRAAMVGVAKRPVGGSAPEEGSSGAPPGVDTKV